MLSTSNYSYLDLNSVKNIIGDAKEVMVYGFGDYGWIAVESRLKENGYIVYDYDDLPFHHITYAGRWVNRKCKAPLTSLVIENAKRLAQHQQIIPLVFVVADDSNNLNPKKVAETHSYRKLGDECNLTDSELRRCYKMYAETNPIIKKIIEQSFHFVKFDTNSASIEKLTPFWDDPIWQQHWSLRRHEHNSQKKRSWKVILNSEINKIDPQLLLFKPQMPATNITENTENKDDNKNTLKV